MNFFFTIIASNFSNALIDLIKKTKKQGGYHGCDDVVIGLTTTYAIGAN